MPEIKFKLSDSQKYDALMDLLNPNFRETYEFEAIIVDVYDEYALVRNLEAGNYERVYYTKNDETDSLELGERQEVFIMDITAAEKSTLDTLRKLNGETYELVSDTLANAAENFEKLTAADAQIVELNDNLSTLNTKVEELTASVESYTASDAEKDSTISTLTEELNGLKTYKHEVELKEKNEVISEYDNLLSDEVIEEFRSHIDEYTAVDLDMHLAYALKKSNKSVFQSGNNNAGYVPAVDTPKTGIEAILDKYKK